MAYTQKMSQIETLNEQVWCTIAPSKVHGVGVFAIRDIAKGQRIYAMRGNEQAEWLLTDDFSLLHPAIFTLILQRWPLITKGQPFQSPNYDVRLTSFMNHSDTPNYDYKTDCALTDIQTGEEIFEDYGDEKWIVDC